MGFFREQVALVFEVVNSNLTEENKYAAVEALLIQCNLQGAMDERYIPDSPDLEKEMELWVATEELARKNLSPEKHAKAAQKLITEQESVEVVCG